MWIYFLMTFFSEGWSLNQVRGDLYFNPESSANLTCGNKTWKDTLFVIWHLQLRNRNCLISVSDGESSNNCGNGISVGNTSSGQPVLHISNTSIKTVEVYKCELVYNGGKEDCTYNVSVIVSPEVNAWLELRDGKMVAVCKAERGNPAANISWSPTRNILTYKLEHSEGLYQVESSVEASEGGDPENISCIVSHLSWRDDRKLVPKLKTASFPWKWVSAVLVIVVVLLVLFFAELKVMIWRRCQKSDSSSLKPPPKEEVEEVEPYASYVQRVNSIYNSSADLFS